ncbi:MAG TPA: hypothetical protein VIC53_00120 [Wenzhouxiangella sp.]
MSQILELVTLLQNDPSHQETLRSAESYDELVRAFMGIAESAGLYIEEGVIEAAITAAGLGEDDG